MQSNFKDEEIIVMADVGSSFGIKGLNKINVHTQTLDALLNYKRFFLQLQGADWIEVDVSDIKVHGAKIIARISGNQTPEEAKLLSCSLLGVLKSELPEIEDDNFYYYQIEGLIVYDTNNKKLGKVNKIWSNGAHDVFEVVGPKTQIFPYIDSVVLSVDLLAGTMVVNNLYED